MRENPYQCIDVMTNETLGWYADPDTPYIIHKGKPIDVFYRPGRKGKAKR